MSVKSNMTIGIAIMTLNGRAMLARLLPQVTRESQVSKVIVFDSESDDGLVEYVRSIREIGLVTVRRSDFNHGGTRELARRALQTDIVVFLTQDVIPIAGWLGALVGPICSGEAQVSYARQLPHVGADIFESFPRMFNYPAKSETRRLEDATTKGVYTFFCSDSCAAYLNRALDNVGGFMNTLTNEDYFAVARILKNGGAIRYVADAVVYHSHRYTLAEEFQRYFDTGYVRAENAWVNAIVGAAERRGSSLAARLLWHLIWRKPWLTPYATLQLGAKWLGYRLGFSAYSWKRESCRRFSSQKYYWTSRHCKHPK